MENKKETFLRMMYLEKLEKGSSVEGQKEKPRHRALVWLPLNIDSALLRIKYGLF